MTRKQKGLIGFTTALLLTGFVVWDNVRLAVNKYTLQTNKTERKFRIVQISDFHNCRSKLEKTAEKTAGEKPDIIVITGDLIDSRNTDVGCAVDLVKKLAAIAPVYYVNGNHEASTEKYKELEQKIKDAGATALRNDHVSVNDDIELYGIDDPYFSWDINSTVIRTIRSKLSMLSESMNKKKYNILLSHRPDAFVPNKDFDLILSGHIHGGQIRIPFVGGVLSPDRTFFPKYDAGEFTKGSTTMIISKGVGNSTLPVRLNDTPEITVIDIIPESEQEKTQGRRKIPVKYL